MAKSWIYVKLELRVGGIPSERGAAERRGKIETGIRLNRQSDVHDSGQSRALHVYYFALCRDELPSTQINTV